MGGGAGLAAVAGLAAILTGCGTASGTTDADLQEDVSSAGDEVASPDGRDDGDADDDAAAAEVGGEGTVLPPVEAVPGCGNRVLDPDEECDDGNRLNEDGCDWLCRLGHGEPPPDVDSTLTDYAAEGDPMPVGDPGTTVVGDYPSSELSLVWTGTEFACAYDGNPGVVRFRRFDEGGRQIDTEWAYDEGADGYLGHDLVWTGDGFGLFFADETRGVLYLRLDWDGKPLGEPILVEADPQAVAPAAAWSSGRFILAWISAGGHEAERAVRAKSVALDGAQGPVTTVEPGGAAAVNVTAGEDGGCGIVVGTQPDPGEYRVRFVRLDASLSEGTFSGVLASTALRPMERLRQPVTWSEGSYAVAWTVCSSCFYPDIRYLLCVATFTAAGELARAPVCNPLGADLLVNGNVVMAAGDRGFLAVVEGPMSEAEPWTVLRFGRLDARGRMLPSSPGLLTAGLGAHTVANPLDVVWDGNGFGVLWADMLHDPPAEHLVLYFRFLRAVSAP